MATVTSMAATSLVKIMLAGGELRLSGLVVGAKICFDS